jgi:hypothetical protein
LATYNWHGDCSKKINPLGRQWGYLFSHLQDIEEIFQVPKDFRSLLSPKFIRLLVHKLETGAMTAEECQTVLKEFMLREFDRKRAEQSQDRWKFLASNLLNLAQSFFKKILQRSPAEPTISMDELTGTVRARRI